MKTPDSSKLKISIVTPVFNSVNTLSKTIESVLAQTYDNFEYIIIDAGSKDGSIDLIKHFADQDARIKFIQHQDRGIHDCYNIAIKEYISGEIVHFINGDDWYYNCNVVDEVMKLFHHEPQLDLVTTSIKVMEYNKSNKLTELYFWPAEKIKISIINTIKICPVLNARFFNKNIFNKVGFINCFDEQDNYIISSDLDFLFKLSTDNVNEKIFPGISCIFLSHSESLTFSGNNRIVAKIHREHIQTSLKYLQKNDKNISILSKIFLGGFLIKSYLGWLVKKLKIIIIKS